MRTFFLVTLSVFSISICVVAQSDLPIVYFSTEEGIVVLDKVPQTPEEQESYNQIVQQYEVCKPTDNDERGAYMYIPDNGKISYLAGLGDPYYTQDSDRDCILEAAAFDFVYDFDISGWLVSPLFIAPNKSYHYVRRIVQNNSSTNCTISDICLTPILRDVEFQLDHFTTIENTEHVFKTISNTVNATDFFTVAADSCTSNFRFSNFGLEGLQVNLSDFDFELRIKEDINAEYEDQYGSFEVISHDEQNIEFLYQHPSILASTDEVQTYHIELYYKNGSQPLIEFPIKISPTIRPIEHLFEGKVLKTLVDEPVENHFYSFCSDGGSISQLTFQKPSESNFDLNNIDIRIKEDPDAQQPDTYGVFNNITIDNDNIIFDYQPPFLMSSQGGNEVTPNIETYHLEIFDKNNQAILYEMPLKMHRPPVVLVHGLGRNDHDFQYFIKELTDGQRRRVFGGVGTGIIEGDLHRGFIYAVNYLSYLPLNDNRLVVSNAITVLKNRLKQGQIATSKVNVFAHSIGGLLARLYLQSIDYKDDIFRLITVATPHFGSFQASYLISDDPNAACGLEYFNEKYLGNATVSPILQDIAINSPFITNLNQSPHLNRNTVPTFCYVENTRFTKPSSIRRVNHIYSDIEALNADCSFCISSNMETDGFVDYRSAQGGIIPNSNQDNFYFSARQQHFLIMASHSNNLIADYYSFINSPKYATSGFHTGNHIPISCSSSPVVQQSSAVKSNSNTFVQINEPSNGQSFTLGDTYNINVTGSSDIVKISATIEYTIDSVIYGYDDGSELNLTNVPIGELEDLTGTQTIIAKGFTSDGIIGAVDTIKINFCPSELVLSDVFLPFDSYQSENSIITNTKVYDEGELHLRAGQSITLNKGFYIEKGVTFSAKIEDCSSTPVIPRNSNQENSKIELEQNLYPPKLTLNFFPNPFSNEASIELFIPEHQPISLEIFDLTGRLVQSITNQTMYSGRHVFPVKIDNLIKGIYFLKLKSNKEIVTKKIVCE